MFSNTTNAPRHTPCTQMYFHFLLLVSCEVSAPKGGKQRLAQQIRDETQSSTISVQTGDKPTSKAPQRLALCEDCCVDRVRVVTRCAISRSRPRLWRSLGARPGQPQSTHEFGGSLCSDATEHSVRGHSNDVWFNKQHLHFAPHSVRCHARPHA